MTQRHLFPASGDRGAAGPMRYHPKISIIALTLFLLFAPSVGWAAITATDLATGGSAFGNSSYTTASITPSANRLVLAWGTNYRTFSTPSTPTPSGNGLTWVEVATVTWDSTFSPTKRTTLFRAMGASPSSGPVTIGFGFTNQSGCVWSIQEFDSVDTSGFNGSGAVVQSATGSSNFAGTGGLSITLAALASSGNATAGGFSNVIDSPTSLSAGV